MTTTRINIIKNPEHLQVTVPPEHEKDFTELIQRGSNLWPDASPAIKEFADVITNGAPMQDYYKQANVPAPSTTPVIPKIDMDAVTAEAVAKVEAEPLPISRFEIDVLRFNDVYQLAQFHKASALAMAGRLKNFKNLIVEELSEIDEIIEKLETAGYLSPVDALTDIADLCGDLQVFCASEMVRFNIPITPVLRIIMDSNMSKLGEDGAPIYRESDDKVMKGPHYWKPEPKIREMLLGYYDTGKLRG